MEESWVALLREITSNPISEEEALENEYVQEMLTNPSFFAFFCGVFLNPIEDYETVLTLITIFPLYLQLNVPNLKPEEVTDILNNFFIVIEKSEEFIKQLEDNETINTFINELCKDCVLIVMHGFLTHGLFSGFFLNFNKHFTTKKTFNSLVQFKMATQLFQIAQQYSGKMKIITKFVIFAKMNFPLFAQLIYQNIKPTNIDSVAIDYFKSIFTVDNLLRKSDLTLFKVIPKKIYAEIKKSRESDIYLSLLTVLKSSIRSFLLVTDEEKEFLLETLTNELKISLNVKSENKEYIDLVLGCVKEFIIKDGNRNTLQSNEAFISSLINFSNAIIKNGIIHKYKDLLEIWCTFKSVGYKERLIPIMLDFILNYKEEEEKEDNEEEDKEEKIDITVLIDLLTTFASVNENFFIKPVQMMINQIIGPYNKAVKERSEESLELEHSAAIIIRIIASYLIKQSAITEGYKFLLSAMMNIVNEFNENFDDFNELNQNMFIGELLNFVEKFSTSNFVSNLYKDVPISKDLIEEETGLKRFNVNEMWLNSGKIFSQRNQKLKEGLDYEVEIVNEIKRKPKHAAAEKRDSNKEHNTVHINEETNPTPKEEDIHKEEEIKPQEEEMHKEEEIKPQEEEMHKEEEIKPQQQEEEIHKEEEERSLVKNSEEEKDKEDLVPKEIKSSFGAWGKKVNFNEKRKEAGGPHAFSFKRKRRIVSKRVVSESEPVTNTVKRSIIVWEHKIDVAGRKELYNLISTTLFNFASDLIERTDNTLVIQSCSNTLFAFRHTNKISEMAHEWFEKERPYLSEEELFESNAKLIACIVENLATDEESISAFLASVTELFKNAGENFIVLMEHLCGIFLFAEKRNIFTYFINWLLDEKMNAILDFHNDPHAMPYLMRFYSIIIDDKEKKSKFADVKQSILLNLYKNIILFVGVNISNAGLEKGEETPEARKQRVSYFATFYSKLISVKFTDFRLFAKFGDNIFNDAWEQFVMNFPPPSAYELICEFGIEESFWFFIDAMSENHPDYFIKMSFAYLEELLELINSLIVYGNVEISMKAIKCFTKLLNVESFSANKVLWYRIEVNLWEELFYREKYTISQLSNVLTHILYYSRSDRFMVSMSYIAKSVPINCTKQVNDCIESINMKLESEQVPSFISEFSKIRSIVLFNYILPN